MSCIQPGREVVVKKEKREEMVKTVVLLVGLSFALAALFAGNAPTAYAAVNCYKNSTVRGAGVPISACPEGMEKDGLLCYPKCKEGYTGVGPVCWENCPEHFVDTGAFCNPKIISGDNSGCPWYDLCGVTFAKGYVILSSFLSLFSPRVLD